MGPIGFQEMIFIFVIALLIFGPKKLPELGRSFGKGIAEFRKASSELRSTFQREMDNIERETQDVNNVADDVRKDVQSSYYDDYYSRHDDTAYGNGDSIAKASSLSTPVAATEEISAEDHGAGAASKPEPSEAGADAYASPAKAS